MSAPAGVDRRGITILATGHGFADAMQGAVPALLPFLVVRHHLGYAAAAALVLATSVSSSVVQPLFGYLSDRRGLSWLLPGGVLTAGAGIALAGLAPGYPTLVLAVVVSGLGIAAFHPEGARYASYVAGGQRASAMSAFSVGGNAGFAAGPLLVAPLVALFGLPGTLVVVVPAALVAALLARELPRLARFREAAAATAKSPSGRSDGASTRDDWPAFVRLGAVTTVRTFAFFGLLTFVPLYFVDVLRTSETAGGMAIAAMLAGGALGTLVGGRLADVIGRKSVLLGSFALTGPLVLAFLAVGPGPAVAVLAVVGFVTIASFSVTVVLGQELLPGRVGVASGVQLGLAIGMGGVGAALLGLVAQGAGVLSALHIVAALPVVAFVLTLTLPDGGRRRRGASAEPSARVASQTR